ncbi:MAG TPA: quinone-dependent dihydroorotate dehydrogenase [Anaerolineales bacterium]|nr:quinone-dependent dihydroorotate dehydrogenase [Anaerolineales bacterium]
MYARVRPLLFRLDAEQAHAWTLRLVEAAGWLGVGRRWLRMAAGGPFPPSPIEVFGLTFPNRLGLAAGYDKDGRALRGLACLGFGHLEMGTATPLPQSGQPRPRLFRLTQDAALINRMGFPNAGLEAVRARLARFRPRDAILGVNIGKGRETPLEAAAHDYESLQRALSPFADYLAVNISSPNTPGLRTLQGRAYLEGLLGRLSRARGGAAQPRPILVKLAPDLTRSEMVEAVEVIEAAGMDGVIAGNTTLSREGLASPLAVEAGGLSGSPLFRQALAMVEQISRRTQGRLPIIGVGGILGGADARAMVDAGASLVQVYTGLVYRGPRLVGEILKALGS